MQTSANVTIPTLEELQQRFHAVPRFRDPNKREYMWFKADDVARVFGYSDFNDELMYTIDYANRVCVGKYYYNFGGEHGSTSYSSTFLGEQCKSFLSEYKNVINQYGVAQLAQRTRLPFCIRFRYWLYSTYTLTMIGEEPVLRDLEIIDDASFIIDARKNAYIKKTENKEHEVQEEKEETKNAQTKMTTTLCDIEYEREITKRLEIEKNFQLEMRKLDLRRLEIDHEYHEKQLKKNI